MITIIPQQHILSPHFIRLLNIPPLNPLRFQQISLHLPHFLPHIAYRLQFLIQHILQIIQVVFDIAANFVCLPHQEHLLFYQLDGSVDMLLMGFHKILFLLDY